MVRVTSILKWVGIAVVGVVLLAVGAVFVLTNTAWGHEQIRTRVVSALNGAAHGVVRIGRIDGNLLRGLTLHDVSITDSTGAPFVAMESIRAGYGLRALIGKKIELSDVELVKPVVVLDRQPNGKWNYERIFPTDTTTTPKDTAGVQFGDWLVFKDVRLRDGNVVIRTPWNPDSALTGAARDSSIKAATGPQSRTVVVAVPGGYQQVQEFRSLTGIFPLIRVAHPDFPSRRVEVDSLRAQILVFAPPAADVRQLHGALEIDSDSVWFAGLEVAMPQSRLAASGTFSFVNSGLRLHATSPSVAFSDVRFAYPPLPAEGTVGFDANVTLAGMTQQFLIRDLALATGTARVNGVVGITLGDTLKIHETDVTFSGITTALVEQLVPAVDIPREGVLSGRAKVDGKLADLALDGDVTFVDTRAGTSRVVATGKIGTQDGVLRAEALRVRLAPVQVSLAQVALKDFPLRGTLNGTATLDGATSTRLVARSVDLTHLDRGERSRFTGTGAYRAGTVPFFDVDLAARPLSLVTVGRFAPAAGLRGSVTGPIRARGTLRDLTIDSELRSSDGGSIAARGRLDLESKDIGYALDVRTALFNANALVEKAPRTSVSASASANGRGFDPATMIGEFAASISASTVDTIAVDSVRARVRIANGIANIDTALVRATGAVADVTGTFGLAKTAMGNLAYNVRVDSLAQLARYFPSDTGSVPLRPARTAEQLARLRLDSALVQRRLAVARAAGVVPQATPVVVDTPAAIPRNALAGSVALQGTLIGGLGGFSAAGNATARGLIAAGSSVQQARVRYTANGVLTDSAAFSVIANADSVTAAGFALDSVAANVTYRNPGGTAQVAVFQNTQRDYALRTDYAIYPDSNIATFQTLRLRFDSTYWTAAHPGAVRWGRPGIELDSIDLRNGKGGRVFADGRLPSEGPANLRLNVANFQVADVLGLLQSDVPARGLVSLNAAVAGTNASPTIRGDARVDSAVYAGTVVPDVRTTFDYANTSLTARADATYTGRQIVQASGTIPINLALSGVEGSRLIDAPATAEMRADSLPLELASRFTDAVSQIQGFAMANATLRGTLRKPDVNGRVDLALGQGRLNALGVTLRNITGTIRLEGDTVVVDSISANSGGRLTITGGVGIAKIAEPTFDLLLRANGARVLDNELGKIRADADIAMTGPFTGTTVRGRARVRDGVFFIPVSNKRESINAGDPAVFAVADTTDSLFADLVPSSSPFVENLRMNLRLAVDRDTWIRSKEANIEVYTDGDLRVNVNRKRQTLTLDGSVNTDRGQYEFLSKRFQIKRGTATFLPTTDINPILQLTGEYEVKQASREALFIRILIGGTLQAPRLALESDAQPPISQSDLLSYLAFGSESGSVLQFGGSSVSGSSSGGGLVGTSAALATKQLAGVALGVVLDEFEGQAARSLGADILNITPAENVPTELASGNFGGFAKALQVEYGRYFSTRSFLGLEAQLGVVPGFRYEQQLSRLPGVSLETTFQPRFFLPEPSLSEQQLRKANSLGMFLVRRWRF